MNSQRDIFSLTIAAFLNAILLSFLSIQLLVPFAFIVMMVLIPVIILLKTY